MKRNCVMASRDSGVLGSGRVELLGWVLVDLLRLKRERKRLSNTISELLYLHEKYTYSLTWELTLRKCI